MQPLGTCPLVYLACVPSSLHPVGMGSFCRPARHVPQPTSSTTTDMMHLTGNKTRWTTVLCTTILFSAPSTSTSPERILCVWVCVGGVAKIRSG